MTDEARIEQVLTALLQTIRQAADDALSALRPTSQSEAPAPPAVAASPAAHDCVRDGKFQDLTPFGVVKRTRQCLVCGTVWAEE